MKKQTALFFWAAFVLFLLVIATSCKKDNNPEPVPPIYGRWHITDEKGDHFDCDIQDGGYLCNLNPALLSTTWFCYAYWRSGDTVVINTLPNSKWLFDFKDPNVAVVTANDGTKTHKLTLTRG